MKLIKIRIGEYRVQHTEWEINYDNFVEGSNRWSIWHPLCRELDPFLEENDQLWHTLGEAKEMLFEYLETKKTITL